ncbi:hypothetical protein [Dinoroseobacter sp. S124A]|uniref:hypothetical protein n=1 Tax=Dinoroseobacter sp. S124A TaxID=3415128 RepID=UPI003C7D0B8F
MNRKGRIEASAGKDDQFIARVTEGYAGAVNALLEIRTGKDLGDEAKIRAAIKSLYDTIVVSPTGRLSPLVAEVSRTMPAVALSFHSDDIAHQCAALEDLVSDGVVLGSFKAQDFGVVPHLVIGPNVTLSLSREMFAKFDDLEDHFSVHKLCDGQIEAIMALLRD